MSKVLVVDDDPGLRGLLKALFTRSGFKVEVAPGGSEAIAALKRTMFDAIVLDLMMRGVSGFDVLAYLEKNHPMRKCVVVISAASSAVLSSATGSAMVESVIRKPFDVPELLNAVRRSVASAASPASAAVDFMTAAGRR